MTELVVSVRNGHEAAIAHACGAAIIDLKEPLHGALGQPASVQVAGALNAVPADAVFSLACGELVEGRDLPLRAGPLATRIALAKAGPAELPSVAAWETHFDRFCRRLPTGTRPVAVAYADFQIAKSPHPWELLPSAARAGAEGFLLDTFSKRNGTLFECLCQSELHRIMSLARRLGIRVALAGSITHKDLRQATLLSARYVALRGGLCIGGRDSALAPHLVRLVRRELEALNASQVQSFSQKSVRPPQPELLNAPLAEELVLRIRN